MILLVNPTATRFRYRIPLSVLSVAASIEGAYPYEIIDGNLESDTGALIDARIRELGVKYVGLTVMPGPQLQQAILLSKRIKQSHPAVRIIWGGYFPSLHPDVVLHSGYVDFVIRDQGDRSFRRLLDACESGSPLAAIPGLSYRNGEIIHNPKQDLIDPTEALPLPYHRVDVSRYIGRTVLGTRTFSYHSSVGCPFLCGFCAVAAVSRARWLGLPAERIAADLIALKDAHQINAVEFHDNNFFTSEKRVAEFAGLMRGKGVSWWGEGRPDTLLDYRDETWDAMRDGGSAMIFFGAESSSQSVLSLMNKGGTQTPDTVLRLAEKMGRYDIIPEFSFVLGTPSPTLEKDIEQDITYIMKIKEINPLSEIILYVYSPVHFDDATLFQTVKGASFAFPTSLDAWLSPPWSEHDLRKRPVTPWLSKKNIGRIRDFEKVLHARYPSRTDIRLRDSHRVILEALGSWRYTLRFFKWPHEIRAAQKVFRYRQPELEGF